MILTDILSNVQYLTPIKILDEDIDTYIYESDSYDGYVPNGNYSVNGILIHNGSLVISVRRI